ETDAELGVKVIRLKVRHWLSREKMSGQNSAVIHKLKALKNKFLNQFVPDMEPGFYRAFCKTEPVANLKDFNFILSSYSPLSAHLIGLKLKKQYPQVKWIADFRDEMSFHPGFTKVIKRRLAKIEKEILELCDYVSSVSLPILNQFKSVSSQPDFVEIRNGFDFPVIKAEETQRDIFRIVYTGTFYGKRKPDMFLKGLAQLMKKKPDLKVAVDFYCGDVPLSVPKALEGVVRVHEKVEYAQVPEILQKASLLFLSQAPENNIGAFSGKIFDYLAVNRPIFALVDKNDVAAQLIEEARAGYICHQSDSLTESDIEMALEKVHEDWWRRKLPVRNWELVLEQSREHQINKLIGRLRTDKKNL
ncbi:MAG: hypothetical protein ACXVAX_08755, partial [Pseudobdellovibrio sp.]